MLSKILCSSTLIVSVMLATVAVCGQQIDPEFGWSLKVEASERRKADQRRPPKHVQSAGSDEIQVETDLVLSDLLVQDKNGTPVHGLRAADFEISESGSPQKIDVFAYGDASIPRSIILVIDHSLSQLRHIDMSIASAKVLVDSLRPNDRMAVVSDDVELIADLTSDKEVLKSSLESLRIKCNGGKFGKSSQYSALFAALNERISRNGTRNIVIFQTDGDELSMIRRSRGPGLTNFRLDDIVSAAERKGVTIYTVFTGSRLGGQNMDERMKRTRRELDDQIRAFSAIRGEKVVSEGSKLSSAYIRARIERILAEEKAVSSVAEETGGLAQSLESPDQAAAVYGRILSDIDRRYLIGYYPSERSDTELREREVRVTLKNKGNYRVVGGRTYVAY
ncbi:MAG: VWA domain-containing protein [Pyrinomonadaceae bacterium]